MEEQLRLEDKLQNTLQKVVHLLMQYNMREATIEEQIQFILDRIQSPEFIVDDARSLSLVVTKLQEAQLWSTKLNKQNLDE